MSAQTNYGFATSKGVAGGIYDMNHYEVNSFIFEAEANAGELTAGMGVAAGTNAGANIAIAKIPAAGSTAKTFEGVVVNGFTNQHDLEGEVNIKDGQNVGVMQRGRIWVKLAQGANPTYGAPAYLVGALFSNVAATAGTTVFSPVGKFIGEACDGLAPVELFGTVTEIPAYEA